MIKKLTEERKKHKQSCIKNGDNSHAIIADLYSDPTHFIFEIIQNAEDAKANQISFDIVNDDLVIEHNGKTFTYNEKNEKLSDIHSITTIGSSTKKDDINKIGKFGAGFKSVFAVTDKPKIYSGQYHFEIQDFIVPVNIKEITLKENITKIILPLKNSEVKEKISQKLQNLEMETLLFLNNINEIKYTTVGANGHYIKDDDKLVENNNNFGSVFIISQQNEDEQSQEYFIINDTAVIEDKNLKISVAYNVEEGQIVKSKSSFLSVFFPTKIDTSLNFLLQAPYRTTPNRETIPFDNEQNKILTNELSNLVVKSFDIIKQENLLNINFLELLPIEKYDRNDFYMNIYNEVKEAIKTNKYIPTNKNSFDSVDNLLFSRVEELSLLLDTNDLKFIWDKNNWVDTNITYDKNRKLRDYIVNELDIEEITFEKFARALTVDFLQLKNDKWLVDFYGIWTNRESAFNKNLKDKHIIKLENEYFTSLYDETGRLQVYKPTKDKSEFKTVKKIFIDNEKSKTFFENYGVTYPDKFSELKEFIYIKYKNEHIDISFDEYKKDIEKIIYIYDTREKEEKKKEIIDLFHNCYIVYTSNNTFNQPQETYLPTKNLMLWFNNSENVDFINNEIYNDRTKNLFEFLGCLKAPRRVKIETNTSNNEYLSIKQYSTRQDKIVDYNIDNLENNLRNMSIEKSLLLWEYVLQYANNDTKSYWQPKFYEGIYKYFYRTEQSKKFNAKFLELLKSTKWLYNCKSKLVGPNDITLDELDDRYKMDDENVKVLEKIFEFKLDDIKKFEENHPDKAIVDKSEFEEFRKFKEQKNKNDEQENENGEWAAEISPDNIDIENIETPDNDDIIETEDLSGQANGENPTETDNNDEEAQENDGDDTTGSGSSNDPNSNIAIGKWGEKFVYNILKNKYPQTENYIIKWLNQNGDVGKGYDFLILKDNEEILYIEAKSKIDEKPKLISITGTQWEWARKLHNQNQGDKYRIYVVSGAGTTKAKYRQIKNPIKKWKEGKLKAHPVNFEL